MSTLKTTNLQHSSAASPAIVLNSSGQATLNGLAYPTEGSLSGRNRIINGDMRIDQRNAGASVTINSAANTYCVDRWFGAGQSTDGVFTLQRSTVAPTGFTNSLLATVTTADSSVGSTQVYTIRQTLEGFNTSDLGWGAASASTITLSFWVRSSVTGQFTGGVTNTAFARSYPFNFTINSANTWEYKSVTISGDTTGTWATDNSGSIVLSVYLGLGSSYLGTAGVWNAGTAFGGSGSVNLISTNGATFYITGVQLEAGSVATPFERRSYGQELALCQRYYYKFPTVYNQVFKNGFYESSVLYFPVTMRAAPSMNSSGSWVLRALNGGTDTAYSGFAYNVTPEGFYLSSTTTNNSNFYSWISGTLIASAEL